MTPETSDRAHAARVASAGASPPFAVPRDGLLFISAVHERCRQLISTGVWEGVTLVKLDAWLNNFRTAKESYFAACLLDALIFRSQAQTIALMQQLLERTIPDALRDDPPPVGDVDWIELLQSPPYAADPLVRLVPVIRESDPPTKSGPLIARLYRRHLQLEERWMIWPWQVDRARDDGVETFLFIDDFLGTGKQFRRFTEAFELRERLTGAHAVYAPLAAHSRGLEYVAKHIPDFRVCSVERLDKSHGLFAKHSRWFSDGSNTPDSARSFYADLLARHKFAVSKELRRGFGRLGLAYSFEHATPNNSLPIFWFRSSSWQPLLER